MSQAKLPPGIIRSQSEKAKRDAIVNGWITIGLWSFIYLFPFAAIFSLSLEPPFLFTVIERLIPFSFSTFPWVSVLITAIAGFLVYACFEFAARVSSLDPDLLLSERIKREIDLFDAVNEFQAAWDKGEGKKWWRIWVTPKWLFIGPSSQLLLMEDLAWVYFRESRTDKAIDAAKHVGASAALQASGAVSGSQARMVREEILGDPKEASSVLVFRSTHEPIPTELPCSDWNADTLFEALSAYNPDVVFGWRKEFETAWREDRTSFKQVADTINASRPNEPAAVRKSS